ncbi:hypothetical protein [Bosea sp. 117]|uniref:hypothetical protein n=1 Tax=Bosea sp. 117 TaxID=1125973 RepID=UPI000494D62C|nr:hypothetical protein [Bosea sp. 117]
MDDGTMEGLIAAALAVGVPLAYLSLQARALFDWRGWWHLAGVVPLVGMVPLFSYSLGAYQENSDVWQLLLMLAAPAGFGYLAVLDAIRWVADAPAEAPRPAVVLRIPAARRLHRPPRYARRPQSLSA